MTDSATSQHHFQVENSRALLNLRNMPKDGMPSPTFFYFNCLLVYCQDSPGLWSPWCHPSSCWELRLMFRLLFSHLDRKGKISHDKSARHLSPLEPGKTVRMETTCGFGKLVTVYGKVRQLNKLHHPVSLVPPSLSHEHPLPSSSAVHTSH